MHSLGHACRFHAFIAGWVAWLAPCFKLVPAVRPEDMNKDPKVSDKKDRDLLSRLTYAIQSLDSLNASVNSS